MDHLTDLLILQDLMEAGSRRGVAVYILLEAQGLPDFLDMMNRLPLSALAVRVGHMCHLCPDMLPLTPMPSE